MFVMFARCDLGFSLTTWTQEIQRIKQGGIWWGQILCSRVTLFIFQSSVTNGFSSTSLARQNTPCGCPFLDRGPRWPPSSNFRLHVNCAREPAPAIIQGHPSFYYFILENRSQPVFRHRAILETAEPLHYISVMILPVSIASCYPYVHFSVLF